MVNVKFSNFDDFFNFLRRAPKHVQQLLLKAYPDYAKQMYDAYTKYFNNPKEVAQKVQPKLLKSYPVATKKVVDTYNKVINDTKQIAQKVQPKLSTTAKTASKTVSNNKGLVKGAGGVAKKVLPAAGAVFEIPNLLDEKSSPQSKALSALGIGGLLTGHPVIGLTALLANGVAKEANENIYKNSEEAYNL